MQEVINLNFYYKDKIVKYIKKPFYLIFLLFLYKIIIIGVVF